MSLCLQALGFWGLIQLSKTEGKVHVYIIEQEKNIGVHITHRSMPTTDHILEDMISYGYLSKIMITHAYPVSE